MTWGIATYPTETHPNLIHEALIGALMTCTYTNGLLNAEEIIAGLNEKKPLTGTVIHRFTK